MNVWNSVLTDITVKKEITLATYVIHDVVFAQAVVIRNALNVKSIQRPTKPTTCTLELLFVQTYVLMANTPIILISDATLVIQTAKLV